MMLKLETYMWWSSCFSAVTEVEKKRKKMVSPQDQGERKGKADNRRLKLFGEAKKESKVAAAAEGVQPDWVRVKARRGQATDSHSLAERARREKISARMKLLQSIVPGCDQITGKAQVLDEIIKYVQLLQNQVECLAAKVAFVDVMLYDCELNPSTIPGASNERLWFLEPPLRSVQEPSSIQYRSLADAALGNSASPLLREDQKPSFSPQVQDGGDLLLDMNNQYFEDIVNEPTGLDTDPAPSNF